MGGSGPDKMPPLRRHDVREDREDLTDTVSRGRAAWKAGNVCGGTAARVYLETNSAARSPAEAFRRECCQQRISMTSSDSSFGKVAGNTPLGELNMVGHLPMLKLSPESAGRVTEFMASRRQTSFIRWTGKGTRRPLHTRTDIDERCGMGRRIVSSKTQQLPPAG